MTHWLLNSRLLVTTMSVTWPNPNQTVAECIPSILYSLELDVSKLCCNHRQVSRLQFAPCDNCHKEQTVGEILGGDCSSLDTRVKYTWYTFKSKWLRVTSRDQHSCNEQATWVVSESLAKCTRLLVSRFDVCPSMFRVVTWPMTVVNSNLLLNSRSELK